MREANRMADFAADALKETDPVLHGDGRFMEDLRRYLAELVAWNTRIHLTGRARPSKTLTDQVHDSVVMLRCAEDALPDREEPSSLRIADIGSGAGFPGIIWKIARPHWTLTLIERRQRSAAFLRRTSAILGFEGIDIEEVDASCASVGDGYDIVVSKAAGRLAEVLPLARSLGSPGSLYVTAKGTGWEKELAKAQSPDYSLAAARPISPGRGYAIALRLLKF